MLKQRILHTLAQWAAGLGSFALIWFLGLFINLMLLAADVNRELQGQDLASFTKFMEEYLEGVSRTATGVLEYTFVALGAIAAAFVIYRLGRVWSYQSRLPWLAIAGITALAEIGAQALVLQDGLVAGYLFVLPTTISTALFQLLSRPLRNCDRCKQDFIPKGSRQWERGLHRKVAYRWKGTDLCPACVEVVLQESSALQQEKGR